MADQMQVRELGSSEQRGVNMAAALAREQLKYAMQLAGEVTPSGTNPEPVLVSALVQAMATNYAAVK